jgi:asparagine synthase (glutamine-hydrolysing)
MMRRALKDIVPREILERRRKAYATRSPLLASDSSQGAIHEVLRSSSLAERGWIDFEAFQRALRETQESAHHPWWPQILQTILFALWLADLGRARLPAATASP